MTSRAAIAMNCRANDVAIPTFVDMVDVSEAISSDGPASDTAKVSPGGVSAGWSTVLVRVPKSVAELEATLGWLRPHLDESATVIGGGMTKMVHTSTSECFEANIGPTTTSLAKKKARLIHPVYDPSLTDKPGVGNETFNAGGVRFTGYPGVFSAGALDAGTDLVRQTLINDPLPLHAGDLAIDLGCGTGVLGVTLARQVAGLDVAFVDEFIPALASTQQMWSSAEGDRRANFIATHRFGEYFEEGSADAIVCNPPFHAGGVKTDQVAWDMFSDSKRVLRKGGVIRIVGNRNLAYHAKLNRIFGNVETLASDNRFVVLESLR